MAKETTSKEITSKIKKDIPSGFDDVSPEICKLKHIAVDKEFENIKIDAERRHNELKNLIGSVQTTISEEVEKSHSNLKDKIVLTEKIIGSKIDSLSDFDDTLKGNGTPGVWESVRSLNKTTRWIIVILTGVVIFELGGSWNSIDWDSLREKIWGPAEIKQVESE